MLNIDLRKLISYTERVKDMIMEDVIEMELVAKKCLNCVVYMKTLFLLVYGHCVL